MAVSNRGGLSVGVAQATSQYYRLVLLVGSPASGKTRQLRELAGQRDWPLVNLGVRLSEQLLDLPRSSASHAVPRALSALMAQDAEGVVLDNLEVLFEPELRSDPLRLLQTLSRNRVVVASWSGSYQDNVLTYAESGHPEARRYRQVEAIVIAASSAAAASAAPPTHGNQVSEGDSSN